MKGVLILVNQRIIIKSYNRMNFSSHTSLIPITLWETKSYRASFCVLHEIEQHSNFQSLESPSSVNNMWTALVYASFHVASCISSALSRTTFDPSCYTNLFIPIIVRASFAHLKKNDNSLSLHQFAIQNWERQTLQVQLQHQTQRNWIDPVFVHHSLFDQIRFTAPVTHDVFFLKETYIWTMFAE